MKAIKFSPIYGNNIGDIAISRAIEHLFLCEGISLESQDILFRAPFSYSRQSIKGGVRIAGSTILQLYFPRLFSALKKIIFHYKKSVANFKRVTADADFVIFGGGNLLMSKMGSDYGYRIAKFSESSRVPVIIFSCGAGPFLIDQKYICETALNYATYISLRDKVSEHYFNRFHGRIKPCVTIDPAFIVSEIFSADDEVDKNVLGVNVISNFFSDEELSRFAKGAYEFAIEHGLSIKVINTSYPADEHTSEKFVSCVNAIPGRAIKIETVSLNADLSNLARSYSDLKMFIGCRMHSLIFALSYKVPSAGFCWDDKVRSMMEAFLDDEFREEFIATPDSNFSDVYRSMESIDFSERLSKAQQLIKSDVRFAISSVKGSRE